LAMVGDIVFDIFAGMDERCAGAYERFLADRDRS
jgi:hypothetical protein